MQSIESFFISFANFITSSIKPLLSLKIKIFFIIYLNPDSSSFIKACSISSVIPIKPFYCLFVHNNIFSIVTNLLLTLAEKLLFKTNEKISFLSVYSYDYAGFIGYLFFFLPLFPGIA